MVCMNLRAEVGRPETAFGREPCGTAFLLATGAWTTAHSCGSRKDYHLQ